MQVQYLSELSLLLCIKGPEKTDAVICGLTLSVNECVVMDIKIQTEEDGSFHVKISPETVELEICIQNLIQLLGEHCECQNPFCRCECPCLCVCKSVDFTVSSAPNSS